MTAAWLRSNFAAFVRRTELERELNEELRSTYKARGRPETLRSFASRSGTPRAAGVRCGGELQRGCQNTFGVRVFSTDAMATASRFQLSVSARRRFRRRPLAGKTWPPVEPGSHSSATESVSQGSTPLAIISSRGDISKRWRPGPLTDRSAENCALMIGAKTESFG
jgi:hypothetical protein